jgi:phage gpG-like protein
MADSILIDFKAAAQFLNEKRFKHGLDGRLQAALGSYLARITQREMGNGTKGLAKLTLRLRTKSSKRPLQDTGGLRKSIVWDRVTNGVEVGSVLRYARLHQEGGTITPKKAKKLAIPATKEARAMSSAFGVRKALENFAKKYGAIRFTPGTIRAGDVILFYRRDSVDVPARPYLFMNADREAKIVEIMQNYLEDGQVQ